MAAENTDSAQVAFETEVHGKWILAGEHSVLRGSPALVFPLVSRSMRLRYIKTSNQHLELSLSGMHGSELQLLFWGVFERACEILKIAREKILGQLRIENSIPVGAGMGASASLCVALARWFQYLGYIGESDLYEFSRNLENLFHGESSGVDIAVALSGKGLHFERSGLRRELQIRWQPRWYISYSGKRGVTMECIEQVKALIRSNPELAMQIDSDMRNAVLGCEDALTRESIDANERLEILVNSLNLAKSCFDRWELTPHQHCDYLKKMGALAVKPTGSGGGGFVLSLWQSEIPEQLKKELIPCFQ